MPATILPFVRPHTVSREPDPGAAAAPEPPLPFFGPHTAPTSRQIAHRWAMLSHLTRHSVAWRRFAPRPGSGGPPDPLR